MGISFGDAQRNKAVVALIKLQSYGVTDEEILSIFGVLDSACLENARRIQFEGKMRYPN